MLLTIDLNGRKDTQKSLLLMDIIEVLGKVSEEQKDQRVERYLKAEYERGNEKVKKAIKKLLHKYYL
jgi:NADH:ubiquinone oxidoreductase subunit 3 (subunit A)